MSTALIICTYKQPLYLEWILASLKHQSQAPDEIIIAEDAEDADTAAVVTAFRTEKPDIAHAIIHVTQTDDGFRKSTILNKAVAKCRSDNLVFLDGDCIPHPAFVMQANRHLTAGVLLFTRPVYLSETFYQTFTAGRKRWTFTIMELLAAKSRSVEAGLYLPSKKPTERPGRALIGSAWACRRSDFVRINGFDETFNIGQYGFEDTDLHHRMTRAGIRSLFAKNLMIYYHFGTPGVGDAKTAARIQTNRELLARNDSANLIEAPLGLDQWINH